MTQANPETGYDPSELTRLAIAVRQCGDQESKSDADGELTAYYAAHRDAILAALVSAEARVQEAETTRDEWSDTTRFVMRAHNRLLADVWSAAGVEEFIDDVDYVLEVIQGHRQNREKPGTAAKRSMDDLFGHRLNIGAGNPRQMFLGVENQPEIYLTVAQGLELAEHLRAVARSAMAISEEPK